MPQAVKSPESIANTLVGKSLRQPDFYDIIEACGEEWDALHDAIAAQLPDHQKRDVRTLQQRVEMYERIYDQLPSKAQTELARYEESKDCESTIRQEAAFLLGVALGRRLERAR